VTRRQLNRVAAGVYAVVDVAVLLAPSIVLADAAQKGGLTGAHGIDLVIASAVVGLLHAGVAYRRLVDENRLAARRVDVWIAAVDSLVVLALAATLLLIAVLGGFAAQHAVVVNRGWPVVWLWVGVQLGAVVIAELTGRTVFRWLEAAAPPAPPPTTATRERVPKG
jgi:Kef-type K+ transport system membrane component KefB